MAHSEQKVTVTMRWGGRVGEEDQRDEREFVGEPRTPLTDDDVKVARFDALSQACAFIEDESSRYVQSAEGDDRPGGGEDEGSDQPGSTGPGQPE